MPVLTLSDFCEQCGFPHTAIPDLLRTLNDRQAAELAACDARARSRSAAPLPEAHPLTSTDEGDWGRLEACIPAESFYYWALRPDVGFDCWSDDTFMREYLRDNPGARVKTVPRTTTVNSGHEGSRVLVGAERLGTREIKHY